MKSQFRVADAMNPKNPDLNLDFDNLNRKSFTRRSALSNRRIIISVLSGNRYNRFNISIITKTSTAQKSNNKYPNVKNFHKTDKNKHIWDFWQIYLESKFIQNWELFEIEIFKILYIRDYCKKITYNVIKIKTNLKNLDYYIITDNIIQNLKNIFDNFDKKNKIDIEFQNSKFIIKIKDSKKIFNIFYIRFIVVIISFNILKRKKIKYFRQFIANRLKYRIIDYLNFTLYREFVIRLRQIDLNIRFIDK